MHRSAFLVGVLFLLILVGCTQGGKHNTGIEKSDSLITMLQRSFESYQQVDTTRVTADYQALLKTEKYAGLAFNFVKIDSLKKQLKQLMVEDRQLRTNEKELLSRIKLLKQAFGNNEYDSLTFSIYLSNLEKETDMLSKRMSSTSLRIKLWSKQADSVLQTLH